VRCWVLREHMWVCVVLVAASSGSSDQPVCSAVPWWVCGGWWCGWLVVGVGGCRVLFENCTVDASILFCVVVKLLRAHGGCLGTRSR